MVGLLPAIASNGRDDHSGSSIDGVVGVWLPLSLVAILVTRLIEEWLRSRRKRRALAMRLRVPWRDGLTNFGRS